MMESNRTLINLIILASIFQGSCSNENSGSKLAKNPTLNNSEVFDSMSRIIECDSIYPNKKVRVELIEHSFEDPELSAILRITKKDELIIKDSLSTSVFAVEFKDFNGDGLDDILIQNSSDVRSNWTWNLYLAKDSLKSFQRSKGFEKIKNPNYLKKHDLVDCLVLSGKNWTCFYQINDDKIHEFDYTVYMGYNSEEKKYYDYDNDYEATLKKILNSKK